MLTLTEITDGFTRSTMSAKPAGCATERISLLTWARAGVDNTFSGPGDGPKPYTAAPRPATTEAISANFRAAKIARWDCCEGGTEGRIGRSDMRFSPEPERLRA